MEYKSDKLAGEKYLKSKEKLLNKKLKALEEEKARNTIDKTHGKKISIRTRSEM